MPDFRASLTEDRILHLVFDMPGRSMNVFSNAVIHQMAAFAGWLPGSDVRGVVFSSAKESAFSAGADLTELGFAYDMIMGAPEAERIRVAREHFAPIGQAFRKMEKAGKPVAIAIHGLALGAGCEIALACHYRVMTDAPGTAIGLPEALVGLFPGAGGTQRIPRLVGIDRSLPILLDGIRLPSAEAKALGIAQEMVAPGEEVAAAERWIRGTADPRQPWDRADHRPPAGATVEHELGEARHAMLARTGGHFPALGAILDCIERGLPERMDRAIEIEIEIFAGLIKRPEPRNMIQTLFLGKQDYDKRRKTGTLPAALVPLRDAIDAAIKQVSQSLGAERADAARKFAGFAGARPDKPPANAPASLWIDSPKNETEQDAAHLAAAAAADAAPYANAFTAEERRLADYTIVRESGFPAYLGGPFALFDYLGADKVKRLSRR
jgi:3-hydroxyacyl-CoA dehydrogenase/enoyl-CoA hydratase/3-hydroxybutyryl-CoA epimerase